MRELFDKFVKILIEITEKAADEGPVWTVLCSPGAFHPAGMFAGDWNSILSVRLLRLLSDGRSFPRITR